MLGFWVCAPLIVLLGLGLALQYRKGQDLTRKLKALEPLVAVDPMTGLFNRRGLENHAVRMVSRALRQGDQQVCAAYIDVNLLKKVNDMHGHNAGDAYLCAVRDVMLECFKRADDIVARVGGDEFVVLFPCKDKEDASRALVRFHALVCARTIRVSEETIHISVSIGGSILTVRPKPPSCPSVPRLAIHTPSNPIMAKLIVKVAPAIYVSGGMAARSAEGPVAISELFRRHLALADNFMNLAKQEGKLGNPQIILDGILIKI